MRETLEVERKIESLTEHNPEENMSVVEGDSQGWTQQRSHSKKKSLIQTCSQCGRVFKSKSDLEEHNVSMHITRARHVCEKCNDIFLTIKDLETHLNDKHTENTVFNCKNCNKNVKTKPEIENHVEGHRTKTSTECDECNERSTTKSSLDEHTEEMITLDTDVGNKCDQSFTLEEELIVHIVTFHAERVFNCQRCDKPYESMSLLRRHDWRCHREIECNICGETIKSRTDIKSHRETKHQMYQKVYCKFFPACIDGEECLYEHVRGSNEVSYCPNGQMCKDQACKISDKKHAKQNVLCMFQANCMRLNCPYTHTTTRKAFLEEGSVGNLRK